MALNTQEKLLDELLVLEYQSGNVKALHLLIKRWHNKLLRRAFLQCNHVETAKDITQESWMAIMNGLSRLQDASKFEAWAYTIVNRKAIDWIRKKQKEREQVGIWKYENTNLITNEGQSDSTEQMKKALQLLESEERNIIDLYYNDAMSVNNISQILAIPEGTVKSRLYTIRKKLEKHYKLINNENK